MNKPDRPNQRAIAKLVVLGLKPVDSSKYAQDVVDLCFGPFEDKTVDHSTREVLRELAGAIEQYNHFLALAKERLR